MQGAKVLGMRSRFSLGAAGQMNVSFNKERKKVWGGNGEFPYGHVDWKFLQDNQVKMSAANWISRPAPQNHRCGIDARDMTKSIP